MVARDLGKQRALCQQHKREQTVESAESHHQVQAAQPVAGGIGSPREPGQKETQRVEWSSIQDGQAALRAATHPGVVLQVAKERVVERIPHHEHQLWRNEPR